MNFAKQLIFFQSLLFLALPTFSSAVLPEGSGSFSFTSERNGREVKVFYVKSEHYNPGNPPVMVFHGMKRNPDEYRDGWISLADQYGLFVVSPLFSEEDYPDTAGYNLGNVFLSEEELVRNPESVWSYRVPEEVFDYLRNTCKDTRAEGYFAFGHSAGSQFLHRKIAFAPDDRLLLAVAANAGWYTFPSFTETWPYGFKGTGITMDAMPAYLASHLLVLLGDQDIDPQHSSLRRTPEAMRQGDHRFERGHNFYEAAQSLAAELNTVFNWQLQTVPGVDHDGERMAPAAAKFMAAQMDPVPHPLERVTHLLAILIIALTIYLVVRRYQTHATLFLSGFSLLIVAYGASRITGNPFTAYEHSPTGWFGFDIFAIVKESFSTRLAKIGLIIMAAGGFARYMSSISASTALVKLSVRPLANLKNPYLLLAFAYAIGQTLNIFVPSAAGLAMLLLVAMYPTLIKLGLRPVSVAAVIGTTACLDLGPASGASNVAATVSGMKPVVYFVQHQLPVAVVVIPVVAILHFFWQRFCDNRFKDEPQEALAEFTDKEPDEKVPAFYALLPVFPLVLLLVFSPLVVKSIQVDVVTAMLISLFFSIGCEAIRHRSLKKALSGIVHFFKGMGDILAKVVTLIVAAEIFATGVKATGLISALIGMVQDNGLGSVSMIIVLVLLIGFTTLITGSGNAALFSFANMIPGIANPMGTATVAMMLPSQLAAGLFRSMSPVAGVIIAVSSAANVSPFAIVRRTSVPMLGGVIAMLLVSVFLG